jgi:hypothetical protein
MPIPAAAPSEAWVGGRSLPGIAGSNSAGGMDSAVVYILRVFKTSDDAFRLSYSIAFDCSIRPFLDLFHSWLYIFHHSSFSKDGLVVSFLQVSSES